MSIDRSVFVYLAVLLTVGVLDALWLGVVARDWYRQAIGHLMTSQPRWSAAALFYLGYPIGLVIFAVLPAGGDLARAALLGAVFGLFCYGTYDLTNWAVLRDWPGWISALDMAWGAGVSAAGAAAGVWAWRVLERAG